MKTLLLTLSLAVAGVSTSQAEIYRPSIVRETTVLGAVAGALIGGHNNDRWAEGAIIGAAAGALVGVAVDQSRPVYSSREIRAPYHGPVVTHAPRVVYVDPYPRAVIIGRPVVYISNDRSHHRHHGRGYGHYRHDRRDHRRDRHDHRR
ncbi:MAG TPA: YMGG-like glycine zipper-containing protein [Opitutus sp.]|nr:YMGG-like glycine zipper-containing protein [Opitutus sp.]